jgi:hypothetical protein
MPRALWLKAPLALRRHPVGLVAVVCAAFLVSVGAAVGPLMNAAADSEALQSKLRLMTPLAAGLVIDRPLDAGGGSVRLADERRRKAAVALGGTLPSVGPPVLTTLAYGQIAGPAPVLGNPLLVVLMARNGSTTHVHKLAGRGGEGVWLSRVAAVTAGVHPGTQIAFVRPFPAPPGASRVELPLVAIYQPLDSDLANPYWVNFIARIRAPNPDAPIPPTFALVSRDHVYRLADKVGGGALGNVYEFPLDTRGMTAARARRIARAFQHVARELATGSALAHRLGCAAVGRPCHVTSELTDAVAVANVADSSLRPVVDLLAAFCVLIALGAALFTGIFTGRRRAAEGHLSLLGGEARVSFLARAAIETLLPAVVGAAVGLAVTVELVRIFTPHGSVDASVFRQAAVRAGLSLIATVFAVALGVMFARGRMSAGRGARRRVGRLPWEVAAIALALASWLALITGGGLVKDSVAGSHPRLAVLLLPALAATALAGLTVRVLRSLLLPRIAPSTSSVAVLLALRRVAAARGLVVGLVVLIAAGIASLAFAEILKASLAANTIEKAFVANGSDVAGLIDPAQSLPKAFRYPITKVTEVFAAGTTDSGQSFELIAVDPPSLTRVLAAHSSAGVRAALRTLANSHAPLPAIAVGLGTGRQTVTIGGNRSQLQIVARARAFPGMQPSQPLLVIPARALAASPTALTYVWATGPPHQVEAALSHSSLSPSFLTTVADFSRSPDVQNITRTYGFLRIVALAISGLGFIALMLYLSSRQRSQVVTSAFLRRMGVTQADQAWSVALESTVLVAAATVVGLGTALITANAIVGHVDPLAQYAPPPATAVPWTLLVKSGVAAIFASGLIGAALALALRRSDVGEELRVS